MPTALLTLILQVSLIIYTRFERRHRPSLKDRHCFRRSLSGHTQNNDVRSKTHGLDRVRNVMGVGLLLQTSTYLVPICVFIS